MRRARAALVEPHKVSCNTLTLTQDTEPRPELLPASLPNETVGSGRSVVMTSFLLLCRQKQTVA